MQTQTADVPSARSTREDGDRLLTSSAVRERLGGVSNMCLWRWAKDDRIRFPEPDMVLNGRRYWRLSTIQVWEGARSGRAA